MASSKNSHETEAPADNVRLSIAGAAVTIPAATLADLWIERVRGDKALPRQALPIIGEVWAGQGGIYAGIVRGDPGQPDYHLIVSDSDHAGLTWQQATDMAKNILDGGYTLPKRKEQAVLFGNVPELFKKEAYWSCEEYADSAGLAWFQNFSYGYQNFHRKHYELRARAVRRLVI